MVYTGSPATSTTDQVRLLVGDTSTSTGGVYLTDTEYTWYIGQAPNVYMAGSLACLGILAQFNASTGNSNISSKKVGDLQINYAISSMGSGQLKTFQDLAETLRVQGTRRGGAPYTGGISEADKTTVGSDSDRVDPDFKVGMMSNPGQTDDSVLDW